MSASRTAHRHRQPHIKRQLSSAKLFFCFSKFSASHLLWPETFQGQQDREAKKFFDFFDWKQNLGAWCVELDQRLFFCVFVHSMSISVKPLLNPFWYTSTTWLEALFVSLCMLDVCAMLARAMHHHDKIVFFFFFGWSFAASAFGCTVQTQAQPTQPPPPLYQQ